MDYIREELLRQRAVLARLLLGQSAEDEERQRKETSETADAAEEYFVQPGDVERFWASRRLADGERFHPAWETVRTAEAEAWAAYSDLGGELPEMELRREMGRAWTEGRVARSIDSAEGAVVYRRPLQGDSTFRRGSAAAARSDEVVPEEHVVTETIWADAGETGSARELSRVFQRDARRYDGGFTLY